VSRRALAELPPRHDRCTWGAPEVDDTPCAEPVAVIRTWHNPHVPGGAVQERAYCTRHGAWARQLEGHLPMTERAVSR
jgi:hypothetical protein